MKEIVTFQVGSYANFIGSHFWNFQDELLGLADDAQTDLVFKSQSLDMYVLYRTEETEKGIATYTPRLVSVDFQVGISPDDASEIRKRMMSREWLSIEKLISMIRLTTRITCFITKFGFSQ